MSKLNKKEKNTDEHVQMYLSGLKSDKPEVVRSSLLALTAMKQVDAIDEIKKVIEKFNDTPHPILTLAKDSLKILTEESEK